MYQNTFANSLKISMKKYKISGQEIADAVGKSQKTISRYSTGEIVPSEKMQRIIFNTIARIDRGRRNSDINDISGYELSPVKDLDIQLSESAYSERDNEAACRFFSALHESTQWFVIEHYEIYCSLEMYEIALVETFALIPKEKQDFILDGLETVRMNFRDMLAYDYTCKKLAGYMMMISECKAIDLEDLTINAEPPEQTEVNDLVEKYAMLLEQPGGDAAEMLKSNLTFFISFDERDWYLLMLVQFLNLSDKGTNMTYQGRIVGDRVFNLISYMEKLAEEY